MNDIIAGKNEIVGAPEACKNGGAGIAAEGRGAGRASALGRLFRRERDANPERGAARMKVKLGVVGLSACAGVTTMACALARYLANQRRHATACVELSDGDEGLTGWNYDMMGMERRFAGREFHSFYGRMAGGGRVGGLTNMDEGINWVLRLPGEGEAALDAQQLTSLVNNVAGDVTVCDFSARLGFGVEEPSARRELLMRLLKEMDLLVCMVNPSPSKLLGGAGRLGMLKEMEMGGHRVLYAVNMFCKGVNRKELMGFLRPRACCHVPEIPLVELLEAEYNCKNPYQAAGVKAAMTDMIEIVLKELGF
ncbi:MAG: hypothetical protein LBG71_06385 [Clostridiales Family XIII bacterium]|jgi:hypothetical protein|nr:hypothetical protein [Clostridiales Family XIII bacterium]